MKKGVKVLLTILAVAVCFFFLFLTNNTLFSYLVLSILLNFWWILPLAIVIDVLYKKIKDKNKVSKKDKKALILAGILFLFCLMLNLLI